MGYGLDDNLGKGTIKLTDAFMEDDANWVTLFLQKQYLLHHWKLKKLIHFHKVANNLQNGLLQKQIQDLLCYCKSFMETSIWNWFD